MKKIKDKIYSLQKIASKSSALKAEGKKIVLCHGTFDLMHIGHLRYLKAAKKFGDILFVTITADAYVLKGPGRPVFSETLRSEMLANLEIVDFVAVIHDQSALPSIISIKPNYYIKGIEYKNENEDVTGKISIEVKEVEKYGGKLKFTDEIVYSSSSLINEFIDPLDQEIKSILKKFKQKGGIEYFINLVNRVKKLKVLFIGETIIDQYEYVNILGKASKEAIIATQHKGFEYFAGGVLASAGHLSDFVRDIVVITGLGKKDDNNKYIKNLLKDNINLDPIYLEDRPTVRKKRVVDHSYFKKMFETYYMDDSPLSKEEEAVILAKLEKYINDVDLVIVNDFGHGLMSEKIIKLISKKSKFLSVNTQTNSGNRGFNYINKYKNADYVVIDEPEFRLASQDKHTKLDLLATKKIPELINTKKFIITMGKNGCMAFSNNKFLSSMPALTNKVVDTVGAGDAFFSISSAFAAISSDLEDLCLIGNIAGALKVEILGHRSFLEKAKIMKYIETLLK